MTGIFTLQYHSFQNHYTHKIIIFKLFRSLQLQFSGPTRINFRYSYSFVGSDGNFSSQLQFGTVTYTNGPWNYFPKITVTVTKKWF